MHFLTRRWMLTIHVALFLAPAAALSQQDMEDANKAAFVAGMEGIVRDLNDQRFRSFIGSINRQDMVERIFGLRLIDQRVKKDFIDNLDYTWDNLVVSQLRPDEEEDVRATLLGVESRGDRGRAVVRFDLPDLQFNYHEYDLRLDLSRNVVIVDWTDYLNGSVFSKAVGEWLVAGVPGNPAMRKLLDFSNPTDTELFQFRELLKAARDNNLDRYLEILGQLPERYQRQRIVVESTVALARAVRKRRDMLNGLATMAKYYPEEPLYGLMLLTHYFPRREYDAALQALQRVYGRIGVPDAAMEARLSATRLVMGDAAEALALAEKALEMEPGLELGWWSALNSRAALDDWAGSVAAIRVLEDEFGYELDPKALQRNPAYKGLLESSEYADWRASRQ